MSKSPNPNPFLVVAGDLVVDHHLYEGERLAPTLDHRRGVREWVEIGGAKLLQETLERVFKKSNDRWSVTLGVESPTVTDPAEHHAYAVWRPFRRALDEKDDDVFVWRAANVMGYGGSGNALSALPVASKTARPKAPSRILVLDDAGFLFRRRANERAWRLPKPRAAAPEWILLKMSRPIAQGDLWHALATRFADRLVCVVTADELRDERVDISRGLSWERTVEDLRHELITNPALRDLKRCRHLIVRFSCDGALWLDRSNKDAPRAKLVFDAGGAEGEWCKRMDGKVFGSSVAMTAALAHTLARNVSAPSGSTATLDFTTAISAGLSAARDLFDLGHGCFEHALEPTGYPVERIAAAIADRFVDRAARAASEPRTKCAAVVAAFADATVSWPKDGRAAPLTKEPSIVEASQRPFGVVEARTLVGLARDVVLLGTPALKRLPHARFRKLTTADRDEIETLRTLRSLMRAYRGQDRPKRPLSIGVFGPPGAGKSFGVQQLANELFGDQAWLEFNLSQYDDSRDLLGAFHQIRDKVLSGKTPVAFWDEFDAQNYKWLQYLLAPMQDGRFQNGQLTHAIGKCVFIFAGGTSRNYADFGPPGADDPLNQTPAVREYRLRKGPDFHSRLDGYYDVAGPNQRTLTRKAAASGGNEGDPDPADVCSPLRRALLIRGLLGAKDNARVDFDPDLLDALLLVGKYENGARSLEKLILQIKPASAGEPVRRSSLPAPAQLAMHMDAKEFVEIMSRNESFRMSEMIEPLAEGIHETWRASAPRGSKFDKPYAKLDPIDKEDNRAAARRIPEILALAGLGIVADGQPGAADLPSEEEVAAHLNDHLERLAEAEHDGWMAHRLKNGWRQGEPRDDANKIHPLLVPYDELAEREKDKDRNSIRHFPQMIAKARYRISWLKA